MSNDVNGMADMLILFDRAINEKLEKFTTRPIDGDYDSHTFAAMRAAWGEAWECQQKKIKRLEEELRKETVHRISEVGILETSNRRLAMDKENLEKSLNCAGKGMDRLLEQNKDVRESMTSILEIYQYYQEKTNKVFNKLFELDVFRHYVAGNYLSDEHRQLEEEINNV